MKANRPLNSLLSRPNHLHTITSTSSSCSSQVDQGKGIAVQVHSGPSVQLSSEVTKPQCKQTQQSNTGPNNQTENVNDNHLQVTVNSTTMAAHSYTKFDGHNMENAHEWVDDLLKIMTVNGLAAAKQLPMFELQLSGFAKVWFQSLPEDQRNTLDNAVAAFKRQFAIPTSRKTEIRNMVNNMRQSNTQTGRQFIQTVIQCAKPLKMADDDMLQLLMGNLHQNIRLLVQQAAPASLADLMTLPACQVCPSEQEADTAAASPPWATALREEMSQMQKMMANISTMNTIDTPPQVNATRMDMEPHPPPRPQHQGQGQRRQSQGQGQRTHNRQRVPTQTNQGYCYGCGKFDFLLHGRCNNCPAAFSMCNYCGKIGHFAQVCKSAHFDKVNSRNRQPHQRFR